MNQDIFNGILIGLMLGSIGFTIAILISYFVFTDEYDDWDER